MPALLPFAAVLCLYRYARPYDSTAGIPDRVAFIVLAVIAAFAAYVAFRVWRLLRKERRSGQTPGAGDGLQHPQHNRQDKEAG